MFFFLVPESMNETSTILLYKEFSLKKTGNLECFNPKSCFDIDDTLWIKNEQRHSW